MLIFLLGVTVFLKSLHFELLLLELPDNTTCKRYSASVFKNSKCTFIALIYPFLKKSCMQPHRLAAQTS